MTAFHDIGLCLWSAVLTLNLSDLGVCLTIRPDKLAVFGYLNPALAVACIVFAANTWTGTNAAVFAGIAAILTVVNAVQFAVLLSDTKRRLEQIIDLLAGQGECEQ